MAVKKIVIPIDVVGAKKAQAEMQGFGGSLAGATRLLGGMSIGAAAGAYAVFKFGMAAKDTAKEFEA